MLQSYEKESELQKKDVIFFCYDEKHRQGSFKTSHVKIVNVKREDRKRHTS